MDENMKKILLRVKKMMTLANDAGATEGERDNALRMAHATLAKHNLSMAEAEAAGATPEEERATDKTLRTRHAWTVRVANAIAQLFFCEYFYVSSDRKVGHCFVGRLSNVATARELTDFVVKSINREGWVAAKGQAFESRFQHLFCKGAADRVTYRCRELRRAAEQAAKSVPSTGTSIVLASYYAAEQAANQKFIDEQLQLKIRETKSKESRRIGDGYYEGQAYGDKVSLNRQVGRTTGNKQLT